MRALIHHTFAEPAAALKVEEVPDPVAGPGEALVGMTAAAIHNHDLLTVSGDYGFTPDLPARSGTEATGTVLAVGEGVTNIAVGQRVAGNAFGAWAEKFVARAAGLIPVPDAITDESAAQLLSMPASSLALLDTLDVREGDWIIQNAAGGAVGRLVAQFAASRGINVVGLVRRTDAFAELADDGITGIVATDRSDWRDRVAEITGGAPIVRGVDSVGGSATGDLLSVLADGARLTLFGGMGSWGFEGSMNDIIFRGITIDGFWGSKVLPALGADERTALFGEILTKVASGAIALPVDGSYALADIASAVAAHNRTGRVGKVLLRP
jgi:NADPH:quinone reductase-like Zn-dependent oxidoreductase